jgi:hypothetical protein
MHVANRNVHLAQPNVHPPRGEASLRQAGTATKIAFASFRDFDGIVIG